MATSRAYWLIFNNNLQVSLTYRLNLLFEFLGVLLFYFVVLLFWRVITESHGGEVGGFSTEEITTYMFLGAITGSLIEFIAQGDDINGSIKSGQLSDYLVKPISPLTRWWVMDGARRVATTMIGLVGAIPALIYFRSDLLPPASFESFLLFLLSLLIGVGIHFLLFAFFALWAFWVEETWGQRLMLRVIMRIATGGIIPLSFIPGVIGTFMQWLPFKYFAFIPNQLYLGKLVGAAAWHEIGLGFLWIALFCIAVAVTWRRGLQYYRAVGG